MPGCGTASTRKVGTLTAGKAKRDPALGELQHHGGLPAADAFAQRVVVGEQQHR